jgi:alpha-tubulin suppressor-like RCC1 family protein
MHNHNILLEDNGNCIVYGDNKFGQLGILTTDIKLNKLNHTAKIIKISVGGMHSIIYDDCYNLYGFGNNVYGQLGISDTNLKNKKNNYTIPILIFTKQIKEIACGFNFTIIYDNYNNILVTGCNNNCQLGIPDKKQKKTFTILCNEPGIKFIRCGNNYTILYKHDGNLIGFGNNMHGQLGMSKTYATINKPKKILQDKNIIDIQCGNYHTIYVTTDGYVYGTGNNCMGQLGFGDIINRYEFTQIMYNIFIRQIVCGGYYTILLDKIGSVYVCGNNYCGQLGLEDRRLYYNFTKLCDNINIRTISAGATHTTFYENNGNIINFGNNTHSQLGYKTTMAFTHDKQILTTTKLNMINNILINDIYWNPNIYHKLNNTHKTTILTFLLIHIIYNAKYKLWRYAQKYTKYKIIYYLLN